MAALAFVSTRGNAKPVPLSTAIQQGLAPDGGLYMPTDLPPLDVNSLTGLALPELARIALSGFFVGDRLQPQLESIVDSAFNFPAPTTVVGGCSDPLFALELYHGPTAAFKDFGARFLSACLQGLGEFSAAKPLTILVATSGDTGGAVAAAFYRRLGMRVVILYPQGLVSPRQEQQLTCWGENVVSLRVAGTFDDCQRLVKEALVDPNLSQQHRFSSANSINIGRLLPQMMYYMSASLKVSRSTGLPASFIVPAGNLGNAFAALWARALGLPIGRIILAHNANRTVPEYLQTGVWHPRPSICTLASAMDVGNPSNMERIRSLYPKIGLLREQITASSVDDATIRLRIREDFMKYGREWCPHTATAAEVYALLPVPERQNPWVLVSTAHPAKFNDIVEPILGKTIAVPECLERLLHLPQQVSDIPATLQALIHAIA